MAGQKDFTTLLEYPKLREADFVVGVPAKKYPRVIIYDVSRANNDEEIMKTLIEQNKHERNVPPTNKANI